MKSAGDTLIDAFARRYGGQDGVIEGTHEVVRCMAVARPKDENRLEIFVVPIPGYTPAEVGALVFPLRFDGAEVIYRRPARRTGHLTLVD